MTLPYMVRKNRKVEVMRSPTMAPVIRALHYSFEYWLIRPRYET